MLGALATGKQMYIVILKQAGLEFQCAQGQFKIVLPLARRVEDTNFLKSGYQDIGSPGAGTYKLDMSFTTMMILAWYSLFHLKALEHNLHHFIAGKWSFSFMSKYHSSRLGQSYIKKPEGGSLSLQSKVPQKIHLKKAKEFSRIRKTCRALQCSHCIHSKKQMLDRVYFST